MFVVMHYLSQVRFHPTKTNESQQRFSINKTLTYCKQVASTQNKGLRLDNLQALDCLAWEVELPHQNTSREDT